MYTPDAEVLAYDADAEETLPVTGIVGDAKTQEIQTDSDEEEQVSP
jgi:hypothetical protein